MTRTEVLFLEINPTDSFVLKSEAEANLIDKALRSSGEGTFNLIQGHVRKWGDLQQYILRFQPTILHFSGLGSHANRIILADDSGAKCPVTSKALSKFFAMFKDTIYCVFLNGCYSKSQAEAIAEHIDCVIGIDEAISDEAAMTFTTAFYEAIGFGKNVKQAFDLGLNQISLSNLNEADTPRLLLRNERTADYKLNNTIFRVIYKDITKLDVEAIVSSDDSLIQMGGGVSAAILDAGGESIRKEAQKLTPLRVGNVAVTCAGQLCSKYVFHAVTIDYYNHIQPSAEIIKNATIKCLELADSLNVTSIAFPALGTGVGGFSFKLAADVMMSVIASYLMGNTQLKLVVIALFPREFVAQEDLNIFYERAVGKASIQAQLKKLDISLNELGESINAQSSDKQANQELSGRIFSSQNTLQSANFELGEKGQELSQQIHDKSSIILGKLSDEVISISSEVEKNLLNKDFNLSRQAALAKQQGLQTKLDVLTVKLNELEIQEKTYRFSLKVVPQQLTLEMETVKREMLEIETQLNTV
jgi:O-acetyl-ADP-ribose deacetylase (regulator of RNase III)